MKYLDNFEEAVTMDKTYALLAEWGCDVAAARERLMEDDDLFENCLNIFVKDSNFQELGRYIKSGMYKQAFDCAHTLKGVAGNLGITPIYDATSNLVEELRNSRYDRLEELYKALLNEFDEMQHIVSFCHI